MNSRPELKKQTVHGHETCPECMGYGYNQAIDECRAYYESPQYIKDLIESGKIGVSVNYLKELMRQAYLWGIYDKEEGNAYWCEQGSKDRINDLISDGILDETANSKDIIVYKGE